MKITPLTPDDPIPDLEERLAALHALGPMEYEPGEQEAIARELADLDCAGKDSMPSLAARKP